MLLMNKKKQTKTKEVKEPKKDYNAYTDKELNKLIKDNSEGRFLMLTYDELKNYNQGFKYCLNTLNKLDKLGWKLISDNDRIVFRKQNKR